MGRGRDHSEHFVVHDCTPVRSNKLLQAESLDCDLPEVTAAQLAQRQKQIDFGKNTLGYQEYVNQVPRGERKHWKVVGTDNAHPMTPDATARCSKRTWDGRVRTWRKALHKFDPSMSGKQATQLAATEGTTAGGSSVSRDCGSALCGQEDGQPQDAAAQVSDVGSDAAGTSKKRTYTTAACGKENEGAAKRSQQDQQQKHTQQQQPEQQQQQPQQAGEHEDERQPDQHKQQDMQAEKQEQGQQQREDLDKSISRMVCSVVADVFGEWVDYGDDDIF